MREKADVLTAFGRPHTDEVRYMRSLAAQQLVARADGLFTELALSGTSTGRSARAAESWTRVALPWADDTSRTNNADFMCIFSRVVGSQCTRSSNIIATNSETVGSQYHSLRQHVARVTNNGRMSISRAHGSATNTSPDGSPQAICLRCPSCRQDSIHLKLPFEIEQWRE